MAPQIVVLTGASGAGKTATVRGLAARKLPGVECFYFDSVGVPSPEQMVAEYGSGEQWQAAMTRHWLERLRDLPPTVRLAILDGQVRPSVVNATGAELGLAPTVVLLDCDASTRVERLRGPRNQPELATEQMERWAAYLRGQADALNLPVIDTSRQDATRTGDRVLELLHVPSIP